MLIMRLQRFALGGVLAIALLWAVPASADQLGDTESFRVNTRYDRDGADSITATLRALGSRVYLYVDDRYWSQLSSSDRTSYLTDLQSLASAFDSAIHPRSTAFWGHENDPGVDGDPRVTVLLERLVPGNGGYFETLNGYSKQQVPQGNAREMIVVAVDSVGRRQSLDFSSHEFQHLISFNQKELLQNVSDDVWLNELRSEYNVTVDGYSEPYSGSSLQRRVSVFRDSPSDSLTEWPNTVEDYSIAAVFGHYLADRYGPDVLKYTIHARSPGVKAIEEWLVASSRTERFRDIFGDFMAAVLINDQADFRYSFRSTGLSGLRVSPTETARVSTTAGAEADLSLLEWQPAWVRMNLPSTGTLPPALVMRVNGQAGVDWGGTYIANYNGTTKIFNWRSTNGSAAISVPTAVDGQRLTWVTLAIAQGTDVSTEGRVMGDQRVSIQASLEEASGIFPPASSSPVPGQLRDGDLIRRGTEREVYVIWGAYRRYMVPGTLELYGFQNRPVISVSDDIFYGYTSSNYIRQIGTEPVYAVWPDSTKHHLAITPEQWDASGRDWNSIFIVNERETAFYPSGEPITR